MNIFALNSIAWNIFNFEEWLFFAVFVLKILIVKSSLYVNISKFNINAL